MPSLPGQAQHPVRGLQYSAYGSVSNTMKGYEPFSLGLQLQDISLVTGSHSEQQAWFGSQMW